MLRLAFCRARIFEFQVFDGLLGNSREKRGICCQETRIDNFGVFSGSPFKADCTYLFRESVAGTAIHPRFVLTNNTATYIHKSKQGGKPHESHSNNYRT